MNRIWTALALLASLGSLAACGGIAVIDPDNTGQGGNGTTTSTTSTTSGGAMAIRMTDALGSANCLPPTGSDPLGLAFTLEFDNSANTTSSSATITQASISSGMMATTFDVSPSTSGQVAAGSTVELDFNKTPNSAAGDSGCDYCGATDIRLKVTLNTGGQTVNLDEPVISISCSF